MYVDFHFFFNDPSADNLISVSCVGYSITCLCFNLRPFLLYQLENRLVLLRIIPRTLYIFEVASPSPEC